MIDNLTIVYDGNQLKYANDAATDPLYSGAFNFVDGSNSTGIEYKYDANGNLEQDYDKKISKVQYNSLNLPSTLQFTNGNCADYFYGADGVKRRVVHKTAIANVSVPMGQIVDLADNQVSHTDKTDYCGNVIYENGKLSKILTEEGYVTLSETGMIPTYHYYLKDHQGNNRVVINQTGIVEEVNHYYPFGGLLGGTTNSSQPYKYNGKELDRMHGLDWYDYGARHYDAVLGRFTTMDPMAEKYYGVSTYAYCESNPIFYVDPTGMELEGPDFPMTRAYLRGLWNSVTTTVDMITHPVSTVKGIGSAILDPVNTYHAISEKIGETVDAVKNGNGEEIAYVTGNILGGVAMGMGAAKATSAATKAIKTVGAVGESTTAASTKLGGRVFWSGEGAMDAAMDYAKSTGGITLEMTRAGKNLEKLIQSRNIPWSEARPMWQRLSTRFAQGAEGTVHFFPGKVVNPGSIWLNTEKPILLNQGVNIITH